MPARATPANRRTAPAARSEQGGSGGGADDGAKSTLGKRAAAREMPTQEEIDRFNLPSSYRIKWCKLCDNTSLALSEYTDVNSAWGSLIPWGNGTKHAPSDVYCRRDC